MARNANDTEPMSERPEPADGDEVDAMLNALQVSPPRQRGRAPEITPAPEAIAKAKAGGSARRIAQRTVPMGGAPPLPKEAINARVASDPAEQAFLNKTEERAKPRRRDDKTMLTGLAAPAAAPGAAGYLVSAGIAFVAVLAVGLIGWRIMKYIEAQAPERAAAAEERRVEPARSNAPATSAARAVLTASPPSTIESAPASVPVPTSAGSAANASKPGAKASGDVTQPQPSAAPSTSAPSGQPGGKYGGIVSPELR